MKTPEMETVHVDVTEESIRTQDLWEIMDPVWFGANIYDGSAAYEASFKKFSRAQRLFFAVLWYQAEVNNGGHDQFYSNSTGIVWCDALEGLRFLKADATRDILQASVTRMGGSPSLDRAERQAQMDAKEPDFGDLDDAFYECQEPLEDLMLKYIRAHPSEFLFSGTVSKAKLGA